MYRSSLFARAVAAAVLILVTPASAAQYDTRLVSADATGAALSEDAVTPEVSLDGRFVTFTKGASTFSYTHQVFRKDLQTGGLERVDVTEGGGAAPGALTYAAPVSANGRYVAFTGKGGYTAGTDADQYYAYLRDLADGETTLVGRGVVSDMSADGRYVFFTSVDGLVDGVPPGLNHLYRRDTLDGSVDIVDALPGGAAANSSPQDGEGAASADGSRFAFVSSASNLPEWRNAGATSFVYVKDLDTGALEPAGRADGGAGATDPSVIQADLSADGRYVAWTSSDDPSASAAVSVWLRDLADDETTVVSRDSDEAPIVARGGTDGLSVSNAGRFVAFLDAGLDDTVFVRDVQAGTTVIGNRATGADGAAACCDNTHGPVLSADGGYLVWSQMATNLGDGDDGSHYDVYRRQLLADAPTGGTPVTQTPVTTTNPSGSAPSSGPTGSGPAGGAATGASLVVGGLAFSEVVDTTQRVAVPRVVGATPPQARLALWAIDADVRERFVYGPTTRLPKHPGGKKWQVGMVVEQSNAGQTVETGSRTKPVIKLAYWGGAAKGDCSGVGDEFEGYSVAEFQQLMTALGCKVDDARIKLVPSLNPGGTVTTSGDRCRVSTVQDSAGRTVDTVVQAPTSLAETDLRIAIGEWPKGPSLVAEEGRQGWTLIAGAPHKSWVEFFVRDRANTLLEGVTLYIDASSAGGPVTTVKTRAGGRIELGLALERPGTIRVVAVGTGSNGQSLCGAGSINVIEQPATGRTFTTISGRTWKRQVNGYVTVAKAAAVAWAASKDNALRKLLAFFGITWGDEHPVVQQAAQQPTVEQQIRATEVKGMSLTQILTGPAASGSVQPATVVSAGSANVVAAGSGNVVASGSANVVASGSANVVAAGSGNLIAGRETTGGSSLIAQGMSLQGAQARIDKQDVISVGAVGVVASGSANVIAAGSANVIAAGSANVVSAGSAN